MELSAEYWHERAERVRKTTAYVDEDTREILWKIAGNYDSRARRARAAKIIEHALG
jgi:hypothetical protein